MNERTTMILPPMIYDVIRLSCQNNRFEKVGVSQSVISSSSGDHLTYP